MEQKLTELIAEFYREQSRLITEQDAALAAVSTIADNQVGFNKVDPCEDTERRLRIKNFGLTSGFQQSRSVRGY